MKKPADTIADVIRALKPKQGVVIPGRSPASIRSIVSRIRDEDETRSYHTKAQERGVHVWRLE